MTLPYGSAACIYCSGFATNFAFFFIKMDSDTHMFFVVIFLNYHISVIIILLIIFYNAPSERICNEMYMCK